MDGNRRAFFHAAGRRTSAAPRAFNVAPLADRSRVSPSIAEPGGSEPIRGGLDGRAMAGMPPRPPRRRGAGVGVPANSTPHRRPLARDRLATCAPTERPPCRLRARPCGRSRRAGFVTGRSLVQTGGGPHANLQEGVHSAGLDPLCGWTGEACHEPSAVETGVPGPQNPFGGHERVVVVGCAEWKTRSLGRLSALEGAHIERDLLGATSRLRSGTGRAAVERADGGGCRRCPLQPELLVLPHADTASRSTTVPSCGGGFLQLCPPLAARRQDSQPALCDTGRWGRPPIPRRAAMSMPLATRDQ